MISKSYLELRKGMGVGESGKVEIFTADTRTV